ncbi:hypothetical protein AKJ37_02750 [candidate division MSBL1 archaeon SCGC-AAA259I09]|uniref:Transcription regulator TrmB N-terminal domain-containing protein n=2 Tax=candidate division MSBL1 TaxID=215777 RepID=A0A133UTN1_9EURY|nr:hypothetical protein AKJ37_02750 [candidate division MSBL1 archaeon SCGC-AAA259I09]KXA98495.1 hypothetical protein AKJ39_01905 [candidate division MSBL1 archaeon SCGC-AAA259J03]
MTEDHINLIKELDLKEYHAKTLAHLMQLGETKAPELSDASGVPKARIYGILEDLADRGLIEIKPGRPTKYLPRSPDEIIERTIQNKKTEIESKIQKIQNIEEDFKTKFQKIYETAAGKSRKPLLKTVSVGDPSEKETEIMYNQAKEEIDIVTKSMEWLPKVKNALRNAIERGVEVRVLFLSQELLEDENIPIQEQSIRTFQEKLTGAEIRSSEFLLPLRGSIVDPSYDYTTGKAIFLVEEREVPLTLRDAAITENPSLVAGMKRYFDLIWEHESKQLENRNEEKDEKKIIP